MSQKFINQIEKTLKKAAIYEQPKTKRFARKRSQQSQRSIDSKRSNKTEFQPSLKLSAIRDKQPGNNKINIQPIDFYQHLANQVIIGKQLLSNRQRLGRVRTDRYHQQDTREPKQSKRQSVDYQSQALTAQLQVRNKQLQLMASECKIMKYSLQTQQQKRKKAQIQNKQITCQLSQKSKQLQKIQIQNKKLVMQKEYLVKQIEFLQKINYDDKTRSVQSYRQKYLAKQIEELRKQIGVNKTQTQKHLEIEIKRISHEKYSIETLYKALKVEKQTLIKQFQKYRIQDKESVYRSEVYAKLRDKYILCLDAYKKLKVENVQLQKQLNRSLSNIPQYLLNSNSSLSILLSSSSSQKSNTSLDKQNDNVQRVQKGKKMLFEDTSNQKTPLKKSLSPRNTQQKIFMNFKKPSSPKNNKKSYQTHNTSPQPKNLPKKTQKKVQKVNNYLNQAYRLKIGLEKLPPQNKL